MEQAKEIISRIAGKKIEAIELIRESRDAGRQALAFNSRSYCAACHSADSPRTCAYTNAGTG